MSFFRSKKFWLPLAVCFLIECFFAAGWWEPIAEPASFAGRSVRLKNALLTLDPDAPYYMTVGNSLALLGLDHKTLHEHAAQQGATHYRMALAGSHIAMLHMQTQWAAEHLPQVRGLVFGVGVRAFRTPTLGHYELPAVIPFRAMDQIPWLVNLFGLQAGEPRTYGTVSAMLNYREDVTALLRHPKQRKKALAWADRKTAQDVLLIEPPPGTDICPIDTTTPETCLRSIDNLGKIEKKRGSLRVVEVQRVCRWAAYRQQPPVTPEQVVVMQNAWSELLVPLSTQQQIVFVLMPTHPMMLQHRLPNNLHDTALTVLRDLADREVISLLDLSSLFDDQVHPTCHYFQDMQHATAAGRALITETTIEFLDEIGFYR